VKAVILAAGVGERLGSGRDHPPKALLRFDDKSLLARHLEILRRCGIAEVVIATGYRAELVEGELAAIAAAGQGGPAVRCVLNPEYRDGSIVSLWTVRRELSGGGDVLLMDADVLYDHRLMDRLVTSQHANCFLMDRDIEPGGEPVKLCVRSGELVDFHKVIRTACDYYGESVGFFRLSAGSARRLAETAEAYVAAGRRDEWYEEAVRDVLLGSPSGTFGFEDITGLPWIEIDFPEDVRRAQEEILPRLLDPVKESDA
jgi:choline kinase